MTDVFVYCSEGRKLIGNIKEGGTLVNEGLRFTNSHVDNWQEATLPHTAVVRIENALISQDPVLKQFGLLEGGKMILQIFGDEYTVRHALGKERGF